MTKEEKKREYNRKYRESNKERIEEYNRSYRQANKEKVKESNKRYYEAHGERKKAYNEEWYKANIERKNQYLNKCYLTNKANPTFKLIHSLRSRQWHVLKGKISTTKGLGCTKEFLREYIEKQFTEGMSWDNYGHGNGKWCIDHIKPLDLLHTNPELIPELIHYTNLQPMWYVDNVKKSNKII